jgi:multiple sugar transport system permease protein
MMTTAVEPVVSAGPGGRWFNKHGRSRYRMRTYLVGWSFILPNFIGFGVLTLYPVLMLFYVSFTNWDVFGTAHWTGIANYRRLVNDVQFQTALLNTLYYCALVIPLTLLASLGLALLLNTKLRGVAFFRTAAFFPYITSIVAIAVVWNLLFSPQDGPVNEVLHAIGVAHPPGWLLSEDWAMPAVAIISTWRDMGYYMVLFLAGLQAVPRELIDAARVDGAGAVQRFVHVTLPALRPTTFFIIVILSINSLKVFDLILVMTQGGPGTSTLVLSQFIYQEGFVDYKFGYASAASVALFLLSIIFTAVQFALNRRGGAR